MATAEQLQLEAGIAALVKQRTVLGDAVVDAALSGLQARLAALRDPVLEAQLAPTLKQVGILFLDVVGSTTLQPAPGPRRDQRRDGRHSAQHRHRRPTAAAWCSTPATASSACSAPTRWPRTTPNARCTAVWELLALARTVAAEVLAAHGYAGLDVRVGIHTGGVLLGGGGGGAGDENAVRGLAVETRTARMEQTAPVGALRISHDSYVQVRGLFEVSAPEPLQVKGVDAPVVSYIVHKARPRSFRVATRGIEGVVTRMIGREAEFEALQGAFKRLFTELRWLAVSVVAEAGIGKSRLLDEFQAWTEDRPETVTLFRGRATPQTQGQPFGLLREVIAWRVHLSDDDTLDEAKAKIEQRLMPLFADEPEIAQGHAHLLGHLIGLSWNDSPHVRGILDDPKQIRSRAQHAAAQMFRRISAGDGASDGAPVILQLEDLHWADDKESLHFLDYLAEVNHDVPLLMLAFTRPTLYERRSHWRSQDVRHQRIELHPLDKSGSLMLVNELLKQLPEVPAAVQELITGRADGNPFYMEELVRMLIDQGAIDATGESWRLHADQLLATKVPPTLTGVLQARLDGLPAAERLTLQEASVIGQVFWDLALLALDAQTNARCRAWCGDNWRDRASTVKPTACVQDAFAHAILHQVTYATLLKRQRQVLHGTLAAWLAAQSQSSSARAGDFLGLTAQHYEEAGDGASAAEFHARAAEHAGLRLAHDRVLKHVARALALLENPAVALEDPAAHADHSGAELRWRLLSVRERTFSRWPAATNRRGDLDLLAHLAEVLDDDRRRAQLAIRN